MRSDELPDCVGNGARIFDEIMPDWFRQINLKTLDMWSPINCMYGQLFGSYNGLPKVFKADPSKYGFWPSASFNEKSETHWLLDFHWFNQISHRLNN